MFGFNENKRKEQLKKSEFKTELCYIQFSIRGDFMKRKSSYWNDFIPKSWLSLKNYSWSTFKADLIAGITVGVVALPLAMAFGIASGVDPVYGIYTAIIAGFLVSLLGGSYFQIAGPTGAFVVVIYSVIQQEGYNGLAVAGLFAGIILIAAALFRLGSLIRFIPYPLITGFTTGIALIIFTSQIKDFFGLNIDQVPAEFIPKAIMLFCALPNWDPLTTFVGSLTLTSIILIRRFIPNIPWGIASIVLITAFCVLLDLDVATVYSRYGEIPSALPSPSLPDFSIVFSNGYWIAEAALTIAFLAGVESLLSAVIADGMTGRTHKSNAELLGQGIANIGSIMFGGIPATGALARTALNVKSGAKTPVSGMIHSLTLLVIILAFAPIVSMIPLAGLAAVLVTIAWNMSEIRHFKHLFKAPPGDVAILLTTFFLTVIVDLVVAIEVGMVLSAFLFMKRVSDASGIKALQLVDDEDEIRDDPDSIDKKRIPKDVEVYEINGPYLVGIAESLKGILSNLERPPKVFILRMRKLNTIDASGLHGIHEFYEKCSKEKTRLILSGVQTPVFNSLKKFGLVALIGRENIFSHIDPSLKRAEEIASH